VVEAKRSGAAGGGALPAEAEMLEPMFRDAEAKLAASRLGREARLGTLPLVLALAMKGRRSRARLSTAAWTRNC